MYTTTVSTNTFARIHDIDLASSRGQVLELLRTKRAETRAVLAAITGLSRASVSLIIADLAEAGYIRCEPGTASGRGRPGERLHLNPEARLALGIEVNERRAVAVVAD